MSAVNRRTMIARTTAVAAGTAGAGLIGQPAVAAPRRQGGTAPPAQHTAGAKIGPDDPRYTLLTTGNNQRFVARPDYFKMIRSSVDAEQALRDALKEGKRISVRSGGHCFADLVCNPDVEVVLDFSEMTGVTYDEGRKAFAVEPGARLLNVYETLYKGWGVTIPGGMCYSVGAGGHVLGGGYGLLSRAHGLVVDHLYAVEVVVADEHHQVKTVIATRDPHDPHHDLWWAHTGGGGGNFGLVTRYWFRSPQAHGTEPSEQLVQPPSQMLVSALSFPWADLSEREFTRLMKNYSSWHEANSSSNSPYTALSSVFNVCHKAHGSLDLFTQVDASVPDAEKLLTQYLQAITAGTGLSPKAMTKPSGDLAAMPHLSSAQRMPWLTATKLIGTNNPTITHPNLRGAHKSAYMKKAFIDHHAAALYRYLTSKDYWNADSMVVLFSFGGQVNHASSDATANSQRSSIFKMLFQGFWAEETGDRAGLQWARDFYETFFKDTGGAPVPGDHYEGCYINYPDKDLTDPQRNRSGTPWQQIYYRDNYKRLQSIKGKWDPANVFHHSMSVSPARH
ncbi:FAD-dependent oxidoreductase [Streptomyces sp. NPDC053560]|uniref:FAD-dependent oxidoreductase n=1 Tax=Streptomyces sp. NPDC053560 TaxID=3365711 RepID=UPI0037CF7F6B